MFRKIKRTSLLGVDLRASKALDKEFQWLSDCEAYEIVKKYYDTQNKPELTEKTIARILINRMATIVSCLKEGNLTKDTADRVRFIVGIDYNELELSTDEVLVMNKLIQIMYETTEFYNLLRASDRRALLRASKQIKQRIQQTT